jgi:type II secretory pathway component GspD/PulD (secretin)
MIAKLKVAGLLHKSRVIRLTTLDGQTATSITGMDQPVIQGTSISDAGFSNSIQYRATGTIVRATPLIDSDGLIQVGLNYESSSVENSDGVVMAELKDQDPILAPLIVRKTTTTVARLQNGKAALVSSDAEHDASDEKKPGQVDLLILAAEIVANE